MPEHNAQELTHRLDLIESMIAEGRRQTESWGWAFILWGIIYYGAIAWSARTHSPWAWPVTTLIGVIVSVAIASTKASGHPSTSVARAISSIWIALGISMFLLFVSLGITGRLADHHVFPAIISAILGMANGASAMILRWRTQFACAIVWWAAAVISCFGTDTQSATVFLIAIFLGQIVFGAYNIIVAAHKRHQQGPAHA